MFIQRQNNFIINRTYKQSRKQDQEDNNPLCILNLEVKFLECIFLGCGQTRTNL